MDTYTILTLIARHALTTLGGTLATHGYLGNATLEQFVGAGMIMLGVVWSWWQKEGQLRVVGLLKGHISNISASASGAPRAEAISAAKDAARAVSAVLLAIAVLSLLSPPNAYAQRVPSAALGLPCDFLNLLPGCRYVPPANAGDSKPLDVWQAVAKVALADLEYAKALSEAAGTPAAKVRGQCWDALIVANRRATGVGVKDSAGNVISKPDPHLASDAESLAELVDDLDLKGPLAVACAGSAQMFKLSVLQLISGFVTGAAGLAALGGT